MEQLEMKVNAVIEEIKQLMTKEKEEIKQLTLDKTSLDERENQLKQLEDDLQTREKDLKLNIEKNRERTHILDLREQKIQQEKERLKNTLINLNLEEN